MPVVYTYPEDFKRKVFSVFGQESCEAKIILNKTGEDIIPFLEGQKRELLKVIPLRKKREVVQRLRKKVFAIRDLKKEFNNMKPNIEFKGL